VDKIQVAQLTINAVVKQREDYANKVVALEVKVAMLNEELKELKEKEPTKEDKKKGKK